MFDEKSWATSTDPAAMWQAIRDRVSERQAELFVRACQIGFDGWKKDANWKALAHVFATDDVCEKERAHLLREIIGPWRPYAFSKLGTGMFMVCGPDGGIHITQREHVKFAVYPDTQWCAPESVPIAPLPITEVDGVSVVVLDPAILTWKNGTIPTLARDITEERCEACPRFVPDVYLVVNFGFRPRECKCKGKGYIPRTNPQWELMPVLADACEDAGLDDVTILEHLRRERDGVACPWCEGSGKVINHSNAWIIHSVHCRGGRLFTPFVVGDWALELLKGEPHGNAILS